MPRPSAHTNAIALLIAVSLFPTPSSAQSPPRVHLNTTTLADTLLASDLSPLRRRMISSSLVLSSILFRHDRASLSLFSSLSIHTDLGPDPQQTLRLDHPDDTRLLLDLFLLDLNLDDAFNLKLGRQLILNPAATHDLDGMRVGLFAAGWSLSLYAGLPVQHHRLSFNPSHFDANALEPDPDVAPDLALTTGVTLAFAGTFVDAAIAFQRTSMLQRTSPQPSPSPFTLDSGLFDAQTPPFGLDLRHQRLGFALQGTPGDPLTLTSEARFDLIQRHFERIHFDLTISAVEPFSLGLALNTSRPSFDLDTIWSVFAADARGGYRLHADLNVDHLSLAAAATWRTTSNRQALILPGIMTTHDDLLGGELRASYRLDSPSSRWFPWIILDGRFSAEAGANDALYSADAHLKLALQHHNWLELRALLLSVEHSLQPLRSGESVAGAFGFGWSLQHYGEASVRSEWRTTPSTRIAAKVLALVSVDFDLYEARRTP